MQKNKRIYLVFFSIFLTGVLAAGAGTKNWQFKMDNSRHGPTISFKGIMFNSGTSFVCVEPSFRKQYFYMPKLPFKKQSTDNTLIISSDASKPTDFFLNELKFKSLGPDSMRISVDGKFTKNVEAAIEYIPLCIPAAFMKDAEVDADGKIVIIGNKNKLYMTSKPAKKILIKSKYGTIVITVEHGAGLVMSDRRKKIYKGKELFLFGLQSKVKLSKGDRFKHVISVKVLKNLKSFQPKVKLVSIKPTSGKVIYLSPEKLRNSKLESRLYPIPKTIELDGKSLILPPVITIAPGEFSTQSDFAKLLKELFDNLNIKRKVKNHNTSGFITINKIASPKGNKFDYYELTVNQKGVFISSPTARGAYYALSTLVQLLDSKGRLKVAQVKDWADFKFRGVHICVDSHSLKFHSDIIKKILAPLRYNNIIMECEYAKWPSHTEMHQSWGITPANLKKLTGIATRHFMDVTPLFQTLGHSRYLFNKGANLDIAENPKEPYVYNVSNPRSYKVISELFADMRKVFPKSEYLHIGHDEVNIKKYPSHPDNIGKTALELFMQDLNFYRKYAKKYNQKLMIWDDMLSGRNPDPKHIFFNVEKQLDKNITIVVWDYAIKNDYPVMDMFIKNGNPVICATGQAAGKADDEGSSNIIAFSKSAKKRKVLGMLQTTWSGYTGNSSVMKNYTTQIWAYIQGGISFWNSKSAFIDYYVPSWPVRVFDRLLKKQYPRRYFFSGKEIMIPLNLRGVANAALPADSGMKPGDFTTPYGVKFNLADDSSKVAIVKVDRTSPLKIPMKQKAVAISFLFSRVKHDGSEIGTISIETDKGKIVQPLRTRREIGDLSHELSKSGRFLNKNSRARYFLSRPVFSANGKSVLWQYDLAVNGNMIRKITVSARNNASLLVAGITIIKKDDGHLKINRNNTSTAKFKTSGFFGKPDNSKTLEQIDAEYKAYNGTFSWAEYRKLLTELSKPKYKVLPLCEFNKDNSRDKVVVALRHDSDSHPLKALKMAKIEKAMGIRSSYFLLHSAKYYGNADNGVIIRNGAIDKLAQKLYGMGFEIGIHRDLFNMMWNYQFEPRAFMKEEVAYYKNLGIPVTGSAAHGDGTTIRRKLNEMWIYSEFGKKGVYTLNGINYPYGKYKTSDFGVDYEAYLLKRNDSDSDIGGNFKGKDLDELIKHLDSLKLGTRFILLIHPEHWGKE